MRHLVSMPEQVQTQTEKKKRKPGAGRKPLSPAEKRIEVRLSFYRTANEWEKLGTSVPDELRPILQQTCEIAISSLIEAKKTKQ